MSAAGVELWSSHSLERRVSRCQRVSQLAVSRTFFQLLGADTAQCAIMSAWSVMAKGHYQGAEGCLQPACWGSQTSLMPCERLENFNETMSQERPGVKTRWPQKMDFTERCHAEVRGLRPGAVVHISTRCWVTTSQNGTPQRGPRERCKIISTFSWLGAILKKIGKERLLEG
jgi:hypothetical protein